MAVIACDTKCEPYYFSIRFTLLIAKPRFQLMALVTDRGYRFNRKVPEVC